jgi:hypothetical protein
MRIWFNEDAGTSRSSVELSSICATRISWGASPPVSAISLNMVPSAFISAVTTASAVRFVPARSTTPSPFRSPVAREVYFVCSSKVTDGFVGEVPPGFR